MENNITVIWSFRNRLPVLSKSIKTADETCPKNVKFFLADGASTDETHKELREFCSKLDRKICICETFYRTTCQEAWNLGIMLSDTRYVIIVSSDVVFKSGWFEVISNAFQAGNKYVCIFNHAVFGLDKNLIKRIGFFDEDFGHGAHVDVDFLIRASEENIYPYIIKNKNYYIHDEENLSYVDRIKEETENRLRMDNPENEKRFMKKWASVWPGWEIYKGKNVDLPHPPQNIRVVKRMMPEIDYHPAYIKKMEG